MYVYSLHIALPNAVSRIGFEDSRSVILYQPYIGILLQNTCISNFSLYEVTPTFMKHVLLPVTLDLATVINTSLRLLVAVCIHSYVSDMPFIKFFAYPKFF